MFQTLLLNYFYPKFASPQKIYS